MNPNQLKRLFPNASKSLIEANCNQGSGKDAKLEHRLGNDPLEAPQIQETAGARIHVRFTSVRRRLLDEDNLCEKYLADLLRYSGIIPGDAPHQASIETKQRKAKKGEAEHTIIEVFP